MTYNDPNIDPISYDGFREALDRGEITPDEFIQYTGDPENLFTNANFSNPKIEVAGEGDDIPMFEDLDEADKALKESSKENIDKQFSELWERYKDEGIPTVDKSVAQGAAETGIEETERALYQMQEEAERVKNAFRKSNNREDYMRWRKLQNKVENLHNEIIEKRASEMALKQRQLDANLRKTNPSIDALDSSDESFLMNEANKHDSLDEFIGKMRGSATQYGEYSPKLRKYVKPESVVVGEMPGLDPNATITVYRGIDMDNIGGKKINVGDFVTTDYQDALQYTDSPSKVVSKQVKLKDLVAEYPEEVYLDDPSNPVSYELLYNPGGKIKKITDSKLQEIWERARGK
jgi:hypothetical protein